MATPRVFATLTNTWVNIAGGASGVANMTWQNVGKTDAYIAFTTLAPAGGATDAVHLLEPKGAYFDATGSVNVWARSETGGVQISGTSN